MRDCSRDSLVIVISKSGKCYRLGNWLIKKPDGREVLALRRWEDQGRDSFKAIMFGVDVELQRVVDEDLTLHLSWRL